MRLIHKFFNKLTIQFVPKMKILLLFLLSVLSVFGESQKVNTANKLFTSAVYKQFSENASDNFLISPLSVEIALALVQSGAKGETGEEIRRVLNLSNDTSDYRGIFKKLFSAVKSSEHFKFCSANKIYIKENFTVKSEFKKIATEVFKSEIENLDFSRKTEAAENINKWVEGITENKIKNLISEKSLKDDTVAILINALYFKGEWKKTFKQYLTQKAFFYRNEDKIEVDMMSKKSFYDYYESSELDAKFLKLPFKADNKKVHMIVVLPNAKEGLSNLEKRTKKVFVVPKFSAHFVNVSLPKFKIETTIDFKTILKNLGVRRAFSDADFSGIAGKSGEIEISQVIQKTFIEVNENGVEAASATAVNLHSKSLLEYRGEEKNFNADHPFLFYIKIKNIIVFVGRVLSPNFL